VTLGILIGDSDSQHAECVNKNETSGIEV
jgi:hypothetical protein